MLGAADHAGLGAVDFGGCIAGYYPPETIWGYQQRDGVAGYGFFAVGPP